MNLKNLWKFYTKLLGEGLPGSWMDDFEFRFFGYDFYDKTPISINEKSNLI